MNNFGFCIDCGKVIEIKTRSHCNHCYFMYRETFQQIKLYLKKHPNANAIDIANHTNVKVEQVMQFIRDGVFQVRP
ncbi:hypothetical protein [Alkalihalobacillus sp. BA299]|uniref:hypothetical protein n=1 Tax=Alkalihalobacillus sp. BA299 TaxID=2815938 RepID=UPI001ADA4116|nr:hypothetical protein [Alkalihalobacillus sp. BA299]